MTRKDYIKLAQALALTNPRSASEWVSGQWRTDVSAIADVLEADNPQFDRQRFFAATEGKGN